MKKLAITMIGFAVVSVVLMSWMIYTVKHEVPVKVTVIRLENIKTDREWKADKMLAGGPMHITMQVDEGHGFKEVAAQFRQGMLP